MDSAFSNDNLSAERPTLDYCYVTQVLAFPRSLAVCKDGILDWNATCWLERFPIPLRTLFKIAGYCNTDPLAEEQICELKGFPHTVPQTRLLVVFPHMKKSFDSEEIQEIWTDKIVIPSISST